MKKLIFILLIGLFSCNDDNVTISKEEYYKLKGDTSSLKYPKFFTVNDQKYEIYLGSDNHEYYGMYIATSAYHGYDRHFHYPDCEKCRRRDTL